jgi:hypothetical protein
VCFFKAQRFWRGGGEEGVTWEGLETASNSCGGKGRGGERGEGGTQRFHWKVVSVV